MAEAAITVRGLQMRYGKEPVLKGIDLDVAAGEILGFLGPNGAGKTTTVEILEGYRQRTGGAVSVLGVDPGRPTRRWRERIGLVLQDSQLDPLLTVRELLTLYAAFYPAPLAIDEVVRLVGLVGREDERIGRISGGQRRRADVAVALIGDPELIFLDEPTTGFDPTARREAWETIRGLKALGTTVLLTTHYMEEAQALADRGKIIRAGEIVATGRPDEIAGAGADGARISFVAPDGITPEQVASAAAQPVQRDDGRFVIDVPDAQAALFRLTAWADCEHVRLEAIEVRRPTPEETFLELTRASPAPDGPAPAAAAARSVDA